MEIRTAQSMEVEDFLSGVQAFAILQYLPIPDAAGLSAASRAVSVQSSADLAERARCTFNGVVPIRLAQQNYQAIFRTSNPGRILKERRRLVGVDNATRFAQWRTETAVARLMTGVPMDGGDLFATLKRTFLASQVPDYSKVTPVVHWMHVLGAVEEQDPVQAKLQGREAWQSLAHSVTKDSLLWALQTAHFVDAFNEFPNWLLVDGGPTADELVEWLEALEQRLQVEPASGRYGPAADSSQLRGRHVAKICRDIRVRLESAKACLVNP